METAARVVTQTHTSEAGELQVKCNPRFHGEIFVSKTRIFAVLPEDVSSVFYNYLQLQRI